VQARSEEERKELKYVVEIHDSFDRFLISQGFRDGDRDVVKLKETLLSQGETFPMTSFSGVEYTCILPESGELFAEEKKSSNTQQEEEEEKKDDIEVNENEIPRIKVLTNNIRSMEKGHCFSKSLGYWTYEVCPFREVKQFHRENKDNSISFNLGKYVPNSEKEYTDDTVETNTQQQQQQNNKGFSDELLTPLMSQSYQGGNADRKTIVRYACDRTITGGARVVSVEENPTHVYTILVATDKMCDADDLVYSLLAPLHQNCLRKIGSWWTYEVCAGKRVRQYHRENGGTLIEHMLGIYDKATNVRNRRNPSTSKSNNGTESENDGFLTEIYTKGSVCDITQKPREATVLYRCSELEKFTVIESVVESAPCTYTINILTPLLCSHPDFKDTHLSMNLAKMHCLPKSEFVED